MKFKAFLHQQNWAVILVLIVLVAGISFPIYWTRVMAPNMEQDYGSHIQFAQQILKHQFPPSHILAHPLLQVILAGVFWLTHGRLGLWEGMITLMVISNISTALIVYFWLQPLSGKIAGMLRFLFALTIPFVAPILAFIPLDGRYYFGYIDLANYHNPTVQLLKPIALLVFILAGQIFNSKKTSRRMIFLCGALVIISALIKQNFVICLLPATTFLMVLNQLFKRPVNWRLGLFGGILPSALILSIQSVVTYFIPNAEEGGFIFAPLVVESAFSGFLLWKFLLSIAFPLLVFLFTMRPLVKDPEMQLAWLAFLAGITQVYLFAESGDRMLHGNFRWSAQITLFVLFVASVRWVYTRLPQFKKVSWKQQSIAATAYLLHLVSGIIYYIHCLTSIHYG